MKRLFLLAAAFVVFVLLSIYGWNYLTLKQPLSQVLKEDPRNSGVNVNCHYDYWIKPSVIVFDLRQLSGKSPADVFRVLLHFAASQKEKQYSIVKLAHKGKTKFLLKGDYFKQLGLEYGEQNPVYTMRTFPENALTPEGNRAYGQWTGGLLGVMGKQMEDFNDFHQKWYIQDL